MDESADTSLVVNAASHVVKRGAWLNRVRICQCATAGRRAEKNGAYVGVVLTSEKETSCSGLWI